MVQNRPMLIMITFSMVIMITGIMIHLSKTVKDDDLKGPTPIFALFLDCPYLKISYD